MTNLAKLENCIYWMGPDGVRVLQPANNLKEKTMSLKPGPYKSSTHGAIPLSVRGRELLQKLRDETCEAIEDGAWSSKLSHARGEIAKYMSELEAMRPLTMGYGNTHPVFTFDDLREPFTRLVAQDRKAAEALLARWGVSKLVQLPERNYAAFLGGINEYGANFFITDEAVAELGLKFTQEKPMSDEKKPEPTRTQKIFHAAANLDSTTQALAYLETEIAANKGAPPGHVLVQCPEGFVHTRCHIAGLVKDQWAKLTADALKAAKRRVRDAEKTLADLVASEG